MTRQADDHASLPETSLEVYEATPRTRKLWRAPQVIDSEMSQTKKLATSFGDLLTNITGTRHYGPS